MGKRIAVVGDAFVDILVPVGKEMPTFGSDTLARSAIQQTCGGSSCNTASQLASLSQGLGWKVQFFTGTKNPANCILHSLKMSEQQLETTAGKK